MMKRVILFFVWALLPGCFVFSQRNSGKRAGFQVSFFPPLSTQGMQAPEYINVASFNMLAGVSKSITAFSLSGLGNYTVEDADGFHLSGLGTYAGGNGKGAMLSGLLNRTENYNGFQLSGLLNMTDEMSGIQFAGLSNISKGDVKGFQLSGLINTAARMNGAQLGGLINKAGEMHGFQLAGLANVAGDVSGFQMAGLVNIAKRVKGVQFAALVNIAESNDYPVGLINIVKRGGEIGVGVSYNEIGNTIVEFRSGGGILYGIVGIGFNHKMEKKRFITEAGFGGHIPVTSRFRINNEIKSTFASFTGKEETSHTSFSIMPAFCLFPHLEIFAGPSINYLYTDKLENKSMFPSHNLWKKYSDSKLQQVYFGFSAGIQYIF